MLGWRWYGGSCDIQLTESPGHARSSKATLEQVGAQRELEKSKTLVAEAALRSAQAQMKNTEIALQRATALAAKSFARKPPSTPTGEAIGNPLAAVRVEHDQAFAVERLIDVGVEAVCRQVGLERRLPLEIWQTEDRRANSSVDGMPQHGTDATSGMATR